MLNYRFDFVFSYWLFAWFLLYQFKIITLYNPFGALLVALAYNVGGLFYLLYYQYATFDIIVFIILNFCIKVVPILCIRDKTVRKKDILSTITLYCLFIGWLKINGAKICMFKLCDYEKKMGKKLNTPMINWLRPSRSRS